jgi:2'-5' RNA ligase
LPLTAEADPTVHANHADSTAPRVERLFLGLWPPAEVRAQIVSISRVLSLEGGRLIVPNNLHMTLAFLGDCDATRRECIELAAASVTAPVLRLNMAAIQWRRRTGIVWLTASEVPEPLAQLVASLNCALVPCGHAPDSRPFRAHITVARNVRRLRGEPCVTSIEWYVRDYCLVSSTLTPRGSDYAVVKRWLLRERNDDGD